jgi:hypothetical protein
MSSKKKFPSDYGMFGVTVQPQTLEETDKLRRNIPRSRWIQRALVMYNARMKEVKEESQSGVRGSASNQVPTAPATPSTEVVARKTNTLINKWRSSA